MANKGKVVAIAAGGAAIGALILLTGKAKAEPEEEEKPKPKPKQLEVVALAMKYARLFGVPASLVLAVIDVQSNNRRDAINLKNKRGGAWGYGQVTLLTAQDLVKRFPAIAKKYWAKFDGTGKTLLDPNVNISMTAYQLSLAWKRYKAKPSNWLVSALAYHQGSGNMDKLLQQGGGRLPAKLPPNATIMKARFLAAQKKPVVAKLLAAERASHGVTGSTGALTRSKEATTANVNSLAEKINNGHTARKMLGVAATALNKAYPVVKDTPLVATWAGLREALRNNIDQVNGFAQKVYKEVSAASDYNTRPSLTLRRKVALAVLQSNDVLADTVAAVNDPALTSFWPDFTAAIRQIIIEVTKGVASVLPGWVLPVGVAVGAGALLINATK